MKSWRRNKELLGLAVVMAAFLAFSIAMMMISAFLTNVGFLILGGLLAVFASLLSETIKRPAQARDLARALYEELADRVARCCFDFEAPWQGYFLKTNRDTMHWFRLRKFSPEPLVIFPSAASQLALLGDDAPQALIRFYVRLAAWKRDVDNLAESLAQRSDIERAAETRDDSLEMLRFLAQRLRQTLAPGLRALQALGPLVEEHARIEATAIAGYDEIRVGPPGSRTLRERVGRLIND